MLIVDLFFYLFASVTLLAAIMVIGVKNPVHSVLSLILAFFSTSGLFILLGAEFIAMSLVIVYVGAVAVLFLFVVMMLNITVETKRNLTAAWPLSFMIILIFVMDLVIMFRFSHFNTSLVQALPIDHNISNTNAIGAVLYTKYVYNFEIAGLILLVAMIASIVLTHRVRENVRKQNPSKQFARTKEECMEIVQVANNQGVKYELD